VLQLANFDETYHQLITYRNGFMKYIIIFSTHWGYQEGGINSFNYDFCIHLGKLVPKEKINVTCITYTDPKLANASVASEHNVNLLSLEVDHNFSIQRHLRQIKTAINKITDGEQYIFVGHDVFTGDVANFLRDEYDNSISVVFHHMDYESYYTSKGDVSPIDLEKKREDQREVLSKADIVIAVGPKLKESAMLKTKREVQMVIPGLAKVDNWPHKNEKLIAMTFGRYDPRTDNLKQMRLAAIAFKNFVVANEMMAGPDPALRIIGIQDPKDEIALKNVYVDEGDPFLRILALPYQTKREKLLEELSQASVCLMLSIHEGFGLAGFEAIAAGVPLILSENSGLYEFLNTEIRKEDFEKYGLLPLYISGSNDGSINKKDIENVSKALYRTRDKRDSFQLGILDLKKKLLPKYTWAQTVVQFLRALKFDSQLIEEVISKEHYEKINTIPTGDITLPDGTTDISIEDSLAKLKELYNNFDLQNGCEYANLVLKAFPFNLDIVRWWTLFHNRCMEWTALRKVLDATIQKTKDEALIAECQLGIFESYLNEFTRERHEPDSSYFRRLKDAKEQILETIPKKSLNGKYFYFKARYYEEEWWVSSLETKRVGHYLAYAYEAINRSIELYETAASGYPSSYSTPWWLYCHKCILLKLLDNPNFPVILEEYRKMILEEVEKTPIKASVQMYAASYFVLLGSASRLKNFFEDLDQKIEVYSNVNGIKPYREANVLDNFTFHHIELIFYNDMELKNEFFNNVSSWFKKRLI